MKAAVVNVLGQPPRYQSFPDPQPNADEALIKVRAAGLHPIVKALAAGSHYMGTGQVPMVPGVDGVGTLEDGSRVYFGFARKPWGTMSEFAVVPRDKCFPVPEGLSDAIAAAIPNPGMSAWLSLKERAGLAVGETVLVLGATGVAGRLAVQAARHLGAKRVIGAGRNLESLQSAGVDSIVRLDEPEDSIRRSFAAEAEQGIDVIIDYLWGRPTDCSLKPSPKAFALVAPVPPALLKSAKAPEKPSRSPVPPCAVSTSESWAAASARFRSSAFLTPFRPFSPSPRVATSPSIPNPFRLVMWNPPGPARLSAAVSCSPCETCPPFEHSSVTGNTLGVSGV